MSQKWMREGDKVAVISGNEKGQSGKVLRRKKDRVVIEGLNIRKKHVKQQQKMQPGIVEMEGPIHISNTSFCNNDGKPVKVKVKIGKDGAKQLIYKDGDKEVVYRDVKKKKS